MAPKKGLVGKDAFARMNFLYQAATLCSSFSSRGSQDLAAYYGSVFRNVAKKAVVRAEPEMKRKLCKGCNSLLIPGDNARVRLKKKPDSRLIWTCARCGTIKRFGVRKDYKIWIEREGAVVETMTFSNNPTVVKEKVSEGTDESDEVKKEESTKEELLFTS
ncbi:Ribonuclease P protein subunit p21 [Homalodisca vitripennis]|nr:Ribonuclease P protein subunit p21 [Homalodisca vitripennis]